MPTDSRSATIDQADIDAALEEHSRSLLDTSNQIEQYSENTGMFVMAPVNSPKSLIEANANMVNGANPANMFADISAEEEPFTFLGYELFGDPGEQFKRMIATGSDLTVGFAGEFIKQVGEISQSIGPSERFVQLGEGDFKNFFNLNFSPTGGIASLVADLESVIGTRKDIAQGFIDAGQSLIRANDEFIARHELRRAEPTWLGLVGEGAVSLSAAVGLTLVTRNPASASIYFGTLQQTDAYNAAIEAGEPIDDALFYSNIEGLAVGLLEFIGLDMLMRAGGGTIMRGIKGAATEGAQEAAQESVPIVGRELTGIEDITMEEAIERLLVSGIVGSVLGGPTGMILGEKGNQQVRVIDSHPNEADKDKLYAFDSEGNLTLSKEALFSGILDRVESEVHVRNDMLLPDPTMEISKAAKSQEKIVEQIIDAFSNGVAVDQVFNSTKQLRQKVQAIIDNMNIRRLEAGEAVREGRMRVLQQVEAEVLARLESLEARGAEFVAEFAEKYKGIDITELESALESEDAFEAFMARIELENVDVAEQEKFVAELEEQRGYVRIREQARRRADELENIRSEMELVDTMGPETALSKLAGKKVNVRAAIINKLEKAGYRDLLRGLKTAQQIGVKQTKAISQVVKDVVKALPKELKNEDRIKIINRFSGRGIPETQAELLDVVKEIERMATVAIERSERKRIIEEVEAIIKKHPLEKSTADVNDALEIMNAVRKGEITPQEIIRDLSRDNIGNNADMIAFIYTSLKARDANKDSEPTTSFEWAVLQENLEVLVEVGAAWNKAKNSERVKQDEKDVGEIIELIEKDEPGVVTKIARTVIPDPALAGAEKVKRFTQVLLHAMAAHFNTVLHAFNLQNTFLNQHLNQDKVYRRNFHKWRERFEEAVIKSKAYSNGVKRKPLPLKVGGINHKFTFGEALQIYMYSKNEKTRERLLNEGEFTESDLRKIEAYIETDGVQLANDIFKIYREMYDEINAEYRIHYGYNLPLIEFYSPVQAHFDAYDELSVDGPRQILGLNEAVAFKARKGRNQIKYVDAFSNFMQYNKSTQHWVAYHGYFSRASRVMGKDSVKQAFIDRYGEVNYKQLIKTIEKLKENKNEFSFLSGTAIEYITRNFVTSTIFASPQIMYKQMVSNIGAMAEVGSVDYLKYLGEFMSNPAKHYRALSDHDTSKYRRRGIFDPDVADWMDSTDNSVFKPTEIDSKLKKANKVLGLNVSIGDQFAVATGAHIVMRHLESKGMPREEAMDRAMDWAESTQQSSLPSNRTMLARSTNPIMKMIGVFQSGAAAIFNAEMRIAYQYKNGEIPLHKAIRKIMIYHAVIGGVFGWVASGFENPEEYATNGDMAYSMMMGPMASIPFFGNALGMIISQITGVDGFEDESLADDLVAVTGSKSMKVLNEILMEEDTDWMEVGEAIAELGGYATGVPFENLQDIGTGAVMFVEGDNKTEAVLKMNGFADFVVEKRSEDDDADVVIWK